MRSGRSIATRADGNILPVLRRLFSLLRRTAPVAGEHDVCWRGPYVVTGGGAWSPTMFLLYRGRLHGSIHGREEDVTFDWTIGRCRLEFGCRRSWATHGPADGEVWRIAFPALVRDLRRALADPARYVRALERRLPAGSRTGTIERRLTWRRGVRAPISERTVRRIRRALADGAQARPLRSLSAQRYVRIAGIGYDAAFRELRGLAAREQHARRADTRHGGMLDLPPRDAAAFRDWFESRLWSGSHPFEIAFGHPHGIHLWPSDVGGRWRMELDAGSPGWYLPCARMAVALGEAGLPIGWRGAEAAIAALRGADRVRVGPRDADLTLEMLREFRPDAVRYVEWDPVAGISPATPEDLRRIGHVLTKGTPAGYVPAPG